ncbi:hypothetical protein BH09SUM1_BH09SUM1_29460 [soil metagenome]
MTGALARRARLGHLSEWLPVAALAPFLVLFLLTTLPRFAAPFELEWNEGQSAEQAYRFAARLPLYPGPEGGWVPYMYAPLYHIVFGTAMKVTGLYTLAIGRLISLLATVATLQALFLIVFERTRRVAASLVAPLLYLAWFKATGYWYDLARVDSLALAFAVWGMALTLKREPRLWQALLGAVLLLCGALTKQPLAVVAVFCVAALTVRRPRMGVAAAACLLFLSVNFVFVFTESGNSQFFHYTVTNALAHQSRTDQYFPGALSADDFMRRVPEPESILSIIGAYIHAFRREPAPGLWAECGRWCWLIALFVTGGFFFGSFRRRRLRGMIFLPPLIILAWMSFSAYAKFGGFVNNFQPLYMGLALCAAMTVGSLRLWSRGWFRVGANIAVTLLITAQVYQPWNLPSANPQYGQSAVPVGFLTRLNDAGLTYYPSSQRPPRESYEAYRALNEWLVSRTLANQRVWIIHHQWYAVAAGHRLPMNPDMVRVAEWAQDSVPHQMLASFQSGEFGWLVFDQEQLEYEWLPSGVADVIRLSYEPAGLVPGMAQFRGTPAMQPLTGAQMRPLYLWRLKAP